MDRTGLTMLTAAMLAGLNVHEPRKRARAKRAQNHADMKRKRARKAAKKARRINRRARR